MSALGQKRTFASQNVMSALPPIADMCSALGDVCFVLEATFTGSARRRQMARSPAVFAQRYVMLRHINQPNPTQRQPATQTAPTAEKTKLAISKIIACLPNLARPR